MLYANEKAFSSFVYHRWNFHQLQILIQFNTFNPGHGSTDVNPQFPVASPVGKLFPPLKIYIAPLSAVGEEIVIFKI